MTRYLVALCVVAFASCTREEPERRSATSGDLVVSVTSEYTDLVDTLAQEFARQYTDIRPVVSSAMTRQAVVNLLNDSLSVICIDREFNAEERRVMEEAGMRLTQTRIAWDALVAVVNAKNRTPRFTRDVLSALVTGERTDWGTVSGARLTGPVEFVTTERNSGLYENILTSLGGGNDLKVFAVGDDQEECVDYAGNSTNALALVSLRAVRNLPPTARIVPLHVLVDSASGRMADIMPSQTTVYTGEYGLRYGLYLMTTERRSLTGSGFSTFLLTTQAQKIVQKSGLLPEIIPTRVIQLSSERS